MTDMKATSDAKVAANRSNAQKSTGPKTPQGKRYSRRNALKHGLYSVELLVSEEDGPAFEQLRRQLRTQYNPTTTMRCLGFDKIVAAFWRCKLAMRLESRKLKVHLGASDPSQPENADAIADPRLMGWYGSSKQGVRAGIKALDYAHAEFGRLGYLRDETKESLSRGFGPDFVDTLGRWTPMMKDTVALAYMLNDHTATYGGNPYPSGGDPSKIVLDPQQAFEMVAKLLSERRHFLEELLKIRDQRWSDGEGGQAGPQYDFNPRFLADANRELRLAVAWYQELVEMGL